MDFMGQSKAMKIFFHEIFSQGTNCGLKLNHPQKIALCRSLSNSKYLPFKSLVPAVCMPNQIIVNACAYVHNRLDWKMIICWAEVGIRIKKEMVRIIFYVNGMELTINIGSRCRI